ncbi:hypothetical protein SKC35_01435 [Aquirufa sp. KTFRIE-69F]|uniref:Transporter n=1 Tax=Aquirufa originis TaxID=3096514 RepID=A0ABW6D4H6_9BACT
MKNILLALLCVGVITTSSLGQGCVAVRHMSCSVGTGANSNSMMHPGQWQVSLGFRTLHSYKHYVGADYQPAREAAGTNVINDQQGFDLGVSYSVTDRLSVALNLPLSFNYRSSMYEHYGNAVSGNPAQKRFGTVANGIGDARITASYWVLDPLKHMKGNLSVGLGVKLPTGDWNVQDEFHRRKSDGSDYTVTKAVDQSIQLGDGGVGINLEIQGYQQLFNRTSLYYNGFYMSNPKNVNSASNVAPDKAVTDEMVHYMSVSDQYAGRLGLNYALAPKAGIGATLGARIEGVPAYDLIGDSDGFRRPGYIFSIEPGISYSTAKNTLFVSLPIATQRNRIKSANDWVNNKHGDAAFADYFISATVTHRF